MSSCLILVVYMSHVAFYQHSNGFCYLPTTNDYKILRLVYLDLPQGKKVPPEVEIYELRTGSWRNANVGDFLIGLGLEDLLKP